MYVLPVFRFRFAFNLLIRFYFVKIVALFVIYKFSKPFLARISFISMGNVFIVNELYYHTFVKIEVKSKLLKKNPGRHWLTNLLRCKRVISCKYCHHYHRMKYINRRMQNVKCRVERNDLHFVLHLLFTLYYCETALETATQKGFLC